jgi:hypothetical protein
MKEQGECEVQNGRQTAGGAAVRPQRGPKGKGVRQNFLAGAEG